MNNELSFRSNIIKVFNITLGCAIMAVGLDIFLVPYKIAPGGFSGLATIVFYLTNGKMPVGIFMLIMNVPLLVIGYKSVGKYFVLRSLYGSIILSAFIDVFAYFTDDFANLLMQEEASVSTANAIPDLLLFALVGGFAVGIGLGLVFRSGATTGGSDLLAGILNHFFPWMTVGRLLLYVDGVIIACATLVFQSFRLGLYAVVSMYVTTKVIDAVVEGISFAKGIYIISDKGAEVADRIMKEVERGVTSLYGRGMYTETDKPVLLCIAKRNEIVRIKEVVKKTDPNAFVFLNDIREVLGEGFIEWK